MPKTEWGVKRVCPTTGKRFYDLNKDPIVSPYTGEEVKPAAKPESMEAKLRSQRADLARAKKAEEEGEQEDLVDEEDELIDETDADDSDDTLIEDDDDDDDSPSLSDEDDDDDEPVEFDDAVLLDDDDDDDDAIEDIGDVKPKEEDT